MIDLLFMNIRLNNKATTEDDEDVILEDEQEK
jgi:hypothetical protein